MLQGAAPAHSVSAAPARAPAASAPPLPPPLPPPPAAAIGPTAPPTATMEGQQPARAHPGKRKAESQDNERLSKRLSLLNIGKFRLIHPSRCLCSNFTATTDADLAEHGGSKLYVPVESPSASAATTAMTTATTPAPASQSQQDLDDAMRIDDSKHRVYIYNIDDELSSDSESEEGRLVFLPDIDKHLRANRIPPRVLANDEGELAGMQLVLYSDPKSLTISEDKDSVRKAIIESRGRLRDRQRQERQGVAVKEGQEPQQDRNHSNNASFPRPDDDPDAMDMD